MFNRRRFPAAALPAAAGFLACCVAVGTMSPVAAQSVAAKDQPATASLVAAKTDFLRPDGNQPLRRPAGVSAKAKPATIAKKFIADRTWNSKRLPKIADLTVQSVSPTGTGGSIVKFQQHHHGIPVLGGEVAMQLDAKGNLQAANTESSQQAPASLTDQLGAKRARTVAIASVAKTESVAADSLTTGETKRWILDPKLLSAPGPQTSRLVWSVEVSGDSADGTHSVLVDAQTGSVALTISEHQHAKQRSVCDAANNRLNANTMLPCLSPARAEGDSDHATADVNHAYRVAGDVYDYFSTQFGRDSLDANGMPLRATVRYCPASSADGSCPYDNAFWDSAQQQIVLGAGFGAADDVVAHEFVHGLTEHMSGLIYYQQSGAINESISDIFGEIIDQTNGTNVTDSQWLIGEDLPGGAIRSMADPTQFGDPDRTGSQLFYAGINDEGGVHSNSGVGNKFAYLLAMGGSFNGQTVTGVGLTKTGAIAYRAANLLTSASDYPVFAQALRSACTTLTGTAGITSTDCAQVDKALLATQMDLVPATTAITQAAFCPAGGSQTPGWIDDLENTATGNWTSSDSSIWRYGSTAGAVKAASGSDNLWGQGPDTATTQSMTMTNALAVPAHGYLYFKHAYSFEHTGASYWDGAVIEYSTDGGLNWQDAGSLIDAGLSYSGQVHGTSAFGSRNAFVGATKGFNYGSSRLKLSSLAGQNVKFRFVVGGDTSISSVGWFIDDVSLYSCAGLPEETTPPTPPPPPPTPTQTQAPAPAPAPAAPPAAPQVIAPGKPAKPKSKALKKTRVQLNWKAPAGTGPITYVVRAGTNQRKLKVITQTTGLSWAGKLPGARKGAKFWITVQAQNQAGASPASAAAAVKLKK